jgi:hypothetical protein
MADALGADHAGEMSVTVEIAVEAAVLKAVEDTRASAEQVFVCMEDPPPI